MTFQVGIHIFPIATYSVPTILAMQCRIFNVILDLNSCVHLRELIYTKVSKNTLTWTHFMHYGYLAV